MVRSAVFAVLTMLFASSVVAEEPFGTFSIVAFDPLTQELGIAVQSRAFSVGGGVPWAQAGVGAIATQASTNESFGPRGLALLRDGHSAQETLKILIDGDDGRSNRQLGIVDARGASAAWTGSDCSPWAGDSTLADLSVQGNILAGHTVMAEMVRAYQETGGEMAERLLAALHAAQAAGGDRRGQQSAALLIVRPSEQFPEYQTRYIDLRVEDHSDPINELERVFRIHQASDLLRAHLRYAEYYESIGDDDAKQLELSRVGDALHSALAREDASASTLNALAWFCATADMYLDESLEAATRAAVIEPESSAVLDTLAEVYFRMGNTQDAITTIHRAIAIDPEDNYLKTQLARFQAN